MSRRASRPARDAVVELLRQCALEGHALEPEWAREVVAAVSVDDLLDSAGYHGVSGLAYESLRDVEGLPSPLLAELSLRHAAGVHGHMRALWTLDRALPGLRAAGVPWAVLKGPALVELLYGGAAGRRAYADLDLLVHPAGFANAITALDAQGFDQRDRNWKVLRREMRGQVHLTIDGGIPVDLHWDVVNMYRGRMRVDTAGLVSRATPFAFGGVDVPTLEPEDTILHLAVHAALSGGDRLLWLKDIERAAAAWTPDWEVVVGRARAWRVTRPVGLMLARAAATLDARIPTWVPPALVDRATARIAAWVETVSPWQHAMGRVAAPTRLVARGSAHGLVGGSAWIAWRSVRNLDPRQRVSHDALTPGGDESDRQAFIDAVVRTRNRPT